MSLESDIRSMVESVGMNLYDTLTTSEGNETIFRVNITSQNMIDGKREGVSMEKCVEVTKLISPLLDVDEPVHGNYRLEVSSPGIERKLKTVDHYNQSLGEDVKIMLLDKTKIRGKLLSVDSESKKITVKSEESEETFDFNSVLKAATYFEW